MRYLMKPVPNAHGAAKAQERGVALVVDMLFLIAITGIGVWNARQSMLAENMARDPMDHEVAWQAAESALRDAERGIDSVSMGVLQEGASCKRNASAGMTYVLNPIEFTADCAQGLCGKNDASYASSNWDTASSSSSSSSNVEPWWPKNKGGQWNDDETSKPGRNPVNG